MVSFVLLVGGSSSGKTVNWWGIIKFQSWESLILMCMVFLLKSTEGIRALEYVHFKKETINTSMVEHGWRNSDLMSYGSSW